MPVDPEVSKDLLDAELEAACGLLADQGWELERSADLRLKATIVAPSVGGLPAETFAFELSFDDYKEVPPLIEAVNPATGERNAPGCFPTNVRALFHEDRRICAEWNRAAYGAYGGPHSEWPIANWMPASPGRTKLGGMLSEIWSAIHSPEYRGRGGQ